MSSRRCFVEDKYISEEQCWELQLKDVDCDNCEHVGEEEKPVCNDCKRDDVVLSPRGICGACVAKADLKKASGDKDGVNTIRTYKTINQPRGTCSVCKRPDMSMQARNMCSSCYGKYLKKKKTQAPTDETPDPPEQSSKEVCNIVPTRVLEEMANDLGNAISPRVEFCDDLDKMRVEAQELRLKLLNKVFSGIKSQLDV